MGGKEEQEDGGEMVVVVTNESVIVGTVVVMVEREGCDGDDAVAVAAMQVVFATIAAFDCRLHRR